MRRRSRDPRAGLVGADLEQEKWIRVEFTGGAAKVSASATWHDTAPRVEIDAY
ncbi:Secreted protein OS=Streptomyces alboniger OX=132473 GN=CP975_12595 PE=4 SV=1 [Streptomyces alboniger]